MNICNLFEDDDNATQMGVDELDEWMQVNLVIYLCTVNNTVAFDLCQFQQLLIQLAHCNGSFTEVSGKNKMLTAGDKILQF